MMCDHSDDHVHSVPFSYANGAQVWYNQKDEHHRTDGPAIIRANGSEYWYVNGELHRTDGPAIIRANGSEYWYVNGENITSEVQDWMAVKCVTWPWDTITQVEFSLTWL
jgi:hypothetical protein